LKREPFNYRATDFRGGRINNPALRCIRHTPSNYLLKRRRSSLSSSKSVQSSKIGIPIATTPSRNDCDVRQVPIADSASLIRSPCRSARSATGGAVRAIVWRFEIDLQSYFNPIGPVRDQAATSDRRPRLQVPGCYLARTMDDSCGRLQC